MTQWFSTGRRGSPRRPRIAMALLAVTLSAVSGARAEEPVAPLPQSHGQDHARVALGERLFSDRRLSRDQTLSCASCHDLATGGTVRTPLTHGIGGAPGLRNSPSVFNSSFNFRQFWDGRVDTLEKQFAEVLQAPKVMGMDWETLVARLAGDAPLVASFQVTFGRGPDAQSITDAVVAYERSLITPNSRFDRFLRGERDALSRDERAGYERFKNYGCVACHQGMNLGGNMFQVFGVVGARGDYFRQRRLQPPADLGRFRSTGREEDKLVFRVPSLRNVALTAPYLHDGSAATLADAVSIMFDAQLGRRAEPGDIDLIVKFLGTLTGEYRGVPLEGRTADAR